MGVGTHANSVLHVEVSATSFSGAGAFALAPAEGAGRPSAWTRKRVSAIAMQRQRRETPPRARRSSRIPARTVHPVDFGNDAAAYPSIRPPASWPWTGRISAPRCPRTTTPGRSCPAARRAKRVGASYRDGSISLWRRASWKRWEASPPIARWRPHSALPADAPVDGQVMSVHLSWRAREATGQVASRCAPETPHRSRPGAVCLRRRRWGRIGSVTAGCHGQRPAEPRRRVRRGSP